LQKTIFFRLIDVEITCQKTSTQSGQ